MWGGYPRMDKCAVSLPHARPTSTGSSSPLSPPRAIASIVGMCAYWRGVFCPRAGMATSPSPSIITNRNRFRVPERPLRVWVPPSADILDLDRALTRLSEFDPRKGRVAEMRFFAGLSLHEIGQVLDISIATVERDWTAARAWLYGELTRKPES